MNGPRDSTVAFVHSIRRSASALLLVDPRHAISEFVHEKEHKRWPNRTILDHAIMPQPSWRES